MKFRAAWQIFFALVFAGYMLIWIMIPTKTYRFSWTPRFTTNLSSTTYFREQGKVYRFRSSIAIPCCIYYCNDRWLLRVINIFTCHKQKNIDFGHVYDTCRSYVIAIRGATENCNRKFESKVRSTQQFLYFHKRTS